MQRPLLLIVDGGSLDSSSITQALEAGGWDLAWAESEQVPGMAMAGVSPDVALLVPGAAPVLHHGLRTLDQALPVVVLAPGPAAGLVGPELPVAGYLEPSTAVARWSEALRLYLRPLATDGGKLSTEDLFADILADIASAPAEAPAPKAPVLETPAPPPEAPRPSAPRPAAPSLPKLAPLPALPRVSATRNPEKAPEKPAQAPPVTPPKSGSRSAQQLVADLLGGFDEVLPAPVSRPDEFTFSGISGIKDPFELDESLVSAPPPVPATPVVEPAATPVSPTPLAPPASPAPPVPSTPVDKDTHPGAPPLEEFGNYYLLEKIAVGGMAELFKARQRGVANFEKIVAIKRILPHLSDNDEFVRMFIDEAKLAAQLTHPNIAQIYDLGKASGFYYIAMEYVDGKDLRSLLRKVREFKMPLPEPIAAFVAMKVAGALDYAHRKKGMNGKDLKLVHRDISPQNVLISSEGAVKLVDFGIAKAATKSTQTMAGALKGKLLYMSPEQALGQPLDSRSDIYSLGLVLFELLTGERCFQADSELGVLEKVRLGKVQDVQSVNPGVSKEMSDIIQKALLKDVDRRYPSARFFERDLKLLLNRNGNEPTEHDVAEYANTLLKGTKAQLETLVTTHFQPKVAVPSPLPPPAYLLPPSLQGLEDQPTPIALPSRNEKMRLPEPPISDLERPPENRARLFLMGSLAGVLILAGILWLVFR